MNLYHPVCWTIPKNSVAPITLTMRDVRHLALILAAQLWIKLTMTVCDAQHTFILMTSRNKSDWRFKAPSSKGYSTIGSILPRSLDRILRNSFSTSLPVWGTGPSRWATCFLHRGLLARTCPRSNPTWYLQTLSSTLKTREWPKPTNRRALNLAPPPR